MRDAVGNVESVLVLGGGSEIAAATVRRLINGRCRKVILAVRTPERVADLAEEFTRLGADTVDVVAFDGAEPESHGPVLAEVFATHGDIDLVISAFGILGAQADLDLDPVSAAAMVNVNFAGQVSAITAVAQEMTTQGHGTICVLSSVAGERVRSDNAVYGATKAGLDGYAQALSDRLVGTGVSVLIVRPGFVHSQMTEGMEPAPFATTPERVATDITTALGKRSVIIWSPGILRLVFAIMRHLPRPVWRIVSKG